MKTLVLMEKVWVPSVSRFTFKETLTKGGEREYILRGLMLPFGEISRNNVAYNEDSIKEKHTGIIGKPVMYNHAVEDDSLPLGHFFNSICLEETPQQDSEWIDIWNQTTKDNKGTEVPGWYYAADIDPEEKKVIRKLERRDLRHVSIQLIGGEVKERHSEGKSYTEAWIHDIIEGSLVPAPGFLDTTARFSEALKKKTDDMGNIDLRDKPEKESQRFQKAVPREGLYPFPKDIMEKYSIALFNKSITEVNEKEKEAITNKMSEDLTRLGIQEPLPTENKAQSGNDAFKDGATEQANQQEDISTGTAGDATAVGIITTPKKKKDKKENFNESSIDVLNRLICPICGNIFEADKPTHCPKCGFKGPFIDYMFRIPILRELLMVSTLDENECQEILDDSEKSKEI